MRWLISAIGYVLLTCASLAQVGQIPIYAPIVSGGGSPTWTPTDIQENTSCGFSTTCPQAVNINAGFIVVGVLGQQGGSVTAVTACTSSPVSLTQGPTTGIVNTSYTVDIWYGTVSCSGSQNIVATSSSANSFFRLGVAVGTLSNLTSTTPTTPNCNGLTASVTGGALACSSAVTVPASGFAIAFGTQGVAAAPNLTNMTNDKTLGTGVFGLVFGNSPTAGSLIPNMNGLTNSTSAGIVSATWH